MNPSVAGARPKNSSETALGVEQESIAAIVEKAARYLPSQAPLHAFVHHNTLHAFEHLPFEQAVVEAAQLFGAEPFQTESAFALHIESGRIQPADLDAVLGDMGNGDDRPLFEGGPSRRELRSQRLRHLFEIPEGPALEWLLCEAGGKTRFHPLVDLARRTRLLEQARRAFGSVHRHELEATLLAWLWSQLENVAPSRKRGAVAVRRRDQLLTATGIDTDQWVHPLLIRLCAAFLDQGVAYWTMPEREQGLLRAVRNLYGRAFGPPDPWMRGLAASLRRQEQDDWDAEWTIIWALDALEVPAGQRHEAILQTLLSLRGWAGMMHQFELRPDRAPVERRPARLMDYLAVQLTFDVFAARHALREHAGERASFAELHRKLEDQPAAVDRELVYEAFVAAQLCGVDTTLLADETVAEIWLSEVQAFDSNERRRRLHQAYERRHRIGVLDGLTAHSRLPAAKPPAPEFQAVLCIDDREESLRRHLEELHPACETFGFAGFFGVAMAYQGLDDVRLRPLCPAPVTPTHLILERALDPAEEGAYLAARKRQGVASHAVSVGRKTLTRGTLVAAGLGLASVIPLIGRCLFPTLAERLSQRFRHSVHRPHTRLVFERTDLNVDRDGLCLGYTVSEMAVVVESSLRTMGLDRHFCPIVLMIGHGSSSLNNPHEAAHDCGATGGGRGGPNARAFAAMANHRGVRALLGERGLVIPESTWFVGSYHNTCDDSMTYYDEDLIPAELYPAYEKVKQALHEACVFDAHERCRRFESAPRSLSVTRARGHAQAHAVDLGQPRPEYGHATNAVCIVGRRARTRGLFLDRRAFLVSYDPTHDVDGKVLAGLLLSVGPVGAGINLEYYFSFVDPVGYGCGTKLPHNIVGLFGVMDGHASDLRTGLPWQMVEIHEPVRLLTVVEAGKELLQQILRDHPALDRLVRNGWIQLASLSPDSEEIHVFHEGAFRRYDVENPEIPIVERSRDFYAGRREHLGCAHVRAAFGGGAS